MNKQDQVIIEQIVERVVSKTTTGLASVDDVHEATTGLASANDVRKATIGLPSVDDVRQIVRSEMRQELKPYATRKETQQMIDKMGNEIIEHVEIMLTTKADVTRVERLEHLLAQ